MRRAARPRRRGIVAAALVAPDGGIEPLVGDHPGAVRIGAAIAINLALFAVKRLASAIGDAPARGDLMLVFLLVFGIGVFLFAMWWDASDPKRETRRADVAFWLHLLAAPMIVHPVFKLFGLSETLRPQREGSTLEHLNARRRLSTIERMMRGLFRHRAVTVASGSSRFKQQSREKGEWRTGNDWWRRNRLSESAYSQPFACVNVASVRRSPLAGLQCLARLVPAVRCV